MAVAKVCGIETEYGIQVRATATRTRSRRRRCSINAYARDVARQQTGWDFEDESPGNDARGFAREGSMPPEVETHLVNAVLTNGARYYVDHAHPEFSTPECADALECVLYDKAGEEILRRSMEAADASLPDGQPSSSTRTTPTARATPTAPTRTTSWTGPCPSPASCTGITPHFVTRQIFAGAGKVGSETAAHDGTSTSTSSCPSGPSSSRRRSGLETTLKRPIVNTRDEPHADPQRYRRLHVIVGDANLAEVATFLKVGTTALVLAMIEDDVSRQPEPDPGRPGARPSAQVSLDLTFAAAARPWPTARRPPPWPSSGSCSRLARKYAEDRGLDCLGDEAVGQRGADRAGRTCSTASRPTRCPWPDQVDWVAKLRLLEAYRERHGSTGTTTGWPPWTCSTTTCARRGRCSPGWTPSGWWTAGRRWPRP